MKGNLACLYFGGTFRGFVGTFLDLVVFFWGYISYDANPNNALLEGNPSNLSYMCIV